MEHGDVLEIRWHARGGQGAVTAAKMLAEISLSNNMYFQAFPEYGAERMGAPIQCFNRLSFAPISTYCGVTEPHIVVVVDSTLLDGVDVTAGLAEDGIMIINSTETPAAVRRTANITGRKLYTIDATAISLETLGRPMPSVPILGALIKVTKLMQEEDAARYLEEAFRKRFSPRVVEANLAALRRAFEEVQAE